MNAKRYYDEYWSPKGMNPRKTLLAPTLVAVLDGHIAPGQRVVDYGCGSGDKIKSWVNGRSIDFHGLDVSENAVRSAQNNGLSAQVVDEGAPLPFDDAMFDAAICMEVMEHLFDPLRVCNELVRVVKPGGVVIFTVPNVVELRRRIQFALGVWNPLGDELSVREPWRDPHIRFFTSRSLESMMRMAGLEDVVVSAHFDLSISPRRPLVSRVEQSHIYGQLAKLSPSLFGVRLNAVGRKPQLVGA